MLDKLKEKIIRIPKPAKIAAIAILAALMIGFIAFQLWHMFGTTVIRGVDASHYQGDVSWKAMAESGNVKFVYLKATEGKAYCDPNFATNWRGATSKGIYTGAYHFYSQSSSGYDQARNFISVVPKEKGKLPPAIDIESAITKKQNFKNELSTYIKMITEHYGQKPIFYVTSQVYNLLYDDYSGYQFWIIDYNSYPMVKGWTFWQYSNKGKVAGVDGKIDFNEYRGSWWNFLHMLSK